MLAARMYEYHKPLVLEDIKVPEILPEQVLVRVGGSGMCRSDVQLIDGYFSEGVDHGIRQQYQTIAEDTNLSPLRIKKRSHKLLGSGSVRLWTVRKRLPK